MIEGSGAPCGNLPRLQCAYRRNTNSAKHVFENHRNEVVVILYNNNEMETEYDILREVCIYNAGNEARLFSDNMPLNKMRGSIFYTRRLL